MATSTFNQFPGAKIKLEPFIELNGITTRMCGEIARQNLKVFNDFMQNGAEQLQGLSHAKGLDDVMNIQARYAAKTGPQFYQHAQNVLDTMLECASEYNKWFEKEFQHFAKETKDMQDKMKEKTKEITKEMTTGHSTGHGKKHQ